jgi:hypothetical protein
MFKDYRNIRQLARASPSFVSIFLVVIPLGFIPIRLKRKVESRINVK